MPDAKYDLVSLGEPLLRLSPPGFGQLRRTDSLEVFVVGSQLNVAANLARLGKSAAFLTKLPSNPLGMLAIDTCRSYGLDVSHITTVDGARMGTTYVEFSAAPRAPLAVYDRAGSAASTIKPGDFDWQSILSRARFAYTDGIFPGLSPNCREATEEFFTAAGQCGCTTCFDVNYREHLWTPESARRSWERILPKIDVLVTNRGVSETVFGYCGTDDELMRQYADAFGCRVVCFTSRQTISLQQGGWSSRALEGGEVIDGGSLEFSIIDRYGTGDAWFAGLLYGLMEEGTRFGLGFANAVCALAHTIVGDVAHVSPNEVTAIMDGNTDLRVRR